MKTTILAGCFILGLPSAVWAIEPGPASRAQQQTEAWLQLQVRGDAASKVPQTVTPQEREQSLQRWLESYKHQIPEFYEQDRAGKMGSGN